MPDPKSRVSSCYGHEGEDFLDFGPDFGSLCVSVEWWKFRLRFVVVIETAVAPSFVSTLFFSGKT